MIGIFALTVTQISSQILQDAAVQENFAKAESLIRQAAAQGADLAILPEYHLTSWCPEHPDFLKATLESATYLPRYQALAREVNINIVPGTIVVPLTSTDPNNQDDHSSVHQDSHEQRPPQLTASQDGENNSAQLANMTYWIAAGSGSILGTYQKTNLWHPERPLLTAGNTAFPLHQAFDTPLVLDAESGKPLRAGLLICWDLAFPEAFRALVSDGADLVIVPAWWKLDDVDDAAYHMNRNCEKVFLDSVTVARACENTCAVAFVNHAGCSQVALPILGAAGGGPMPADEEGARVVEVDFGVLKVAERNYKVREDMMRVGWHYGYSIWKGGE